MHCRDLSLVLGTKTSMGLLYIFISFMKLDHKQNLPLGAVQTPGDDEMSLIQHQPNLQDSVTEHSRPRVQHHSLEAAERHLHGCP
jgi:hypothetical protein